jgi:FkbM family methyltransferase
MTKILKELEDAIFSTVNINFTRKLNGKSIITPMIYALKVGVTGEKWMSGVLAELFRYQPDGIFYDVGMNLGQTLIKVKTLAPSRAFVGFEPSPSCLFYLKHLVKRNRWNNVVIVPAGLSDIDGLLPLYGEDDTDPKSTFVEALMPEGSQTSHVMVLRYETIRKDLPGGRVSIVKIDVEGAEPEVIISLRSLIEKDRPVLVMEVLPNKHSNSGESARNAKMLETLRELDYSFYRIMKTPKDAYAGIAPVDDVGNYEDPIYKDHVMVPNEQKAKIEKALTILKQP